LETAYPSLKRWPAIGCGFGYRQQRANEGRQCLAPDPLALSPFSATWHGSVCRTHFENKGHKLSEIRLWGGLGPETCHLGRFNTKKSTGIKVGLQRRRCSALQRLATEKENEKPSTKVGSSESKGIPGTAHISFSK